MTPSDVYLIASGYHILITPYPKTSTVTLEDDPTQPPPSRSIGSTLAFRLHAFKERHLKLDDRRSTYELYQPKHLHRISDRLLAAAEFPNENMERCWRESRRVQEHAKAIGTRVPSDKEAFMMAKLASTAISCILRWQNVLNIEAESIVWFSLYKIAGGVEATIFIYAGDKEIPFETVVKQSFTAAMNGLDEKLKERYRRTMS